MYKINAIISDMTIKRYKMFKFFIAPLLNSFKKIMVQTNKELEHFKSVGVKEDKLIVAGNSKYEITLSDTTISLSYVLHYYSNIHESYP